MKTTVKWFNVSKGYGFLENGTGPDIYVNAKSLRGIERLNTGDLVDFECHVFEGKLVARHVKATVSPVAEIDQIDGEVNGNSIHRGNGSDHGSRGYTQRPQMPRFVMQ